MIRSQSTSGAATAAGNTRADGELCRNGCEFDGNKI